MSHDEKATGLSTRRAILSNLPTFSPPPHCIVAVHAWFATALPLLWGGMSGHKFVVLKAFTIIGEDLSKYFAHACTMTPFIYTGVYFVAPNFSTQSEINIL